MAFDIATKADFRSYFINNNNKIYTPLSERCSQSRVFVSQSYMNHI